MDLFELSKLLGNNIHIEYNHETDLFVSRLEGVCTLNKPMAQIYGVGACRKDSLINFLDVIRGIELFGNKNRVKVPQDISLPSGL